MEKETDDREGLPQRELQPGTPLHGLPVAILMALIVGATFLLSSVLHSALFTACVVAGTAVGGYMLGIWSARRD